MIKSTRFMGHAHAGRTGEWSIVGQDGGQSIEIPGGALFVFADTLLRHEGGSSNLNLPLSVKNVRGKGFFIANCAAISCASDFQGAIGSLEYLTREDGFPKEIVAADAIENSFGIRFWPEHGICVGGKV